MKLNCRISQFTIRISWQKKRQENRRNKIAWNWLTVMCVGHPGTYVIMRLDLRLIINY